MEPGKNCLKQLSWLGGVLCLSVATHAKLSDTFSVDPGTSGTIPGITVRSAAGTVWDAYYYELKNGKPELHTTTTQTASGEPMTFTLPDVKSDTFIEVALTTDTQPQEFDFRWRSLARPKGNSILDYQGQKKLLPPDDFDRYWNCAKQQLNEVEANERVIRVPDEDTSTGILYKVELDSVENTTIVCWFFVPREAYRNGDPDAEVVKKHPAIIITPGYGGTEPPIDRTKEGYVTFSTNPRNHGPSKAYWKSPVEHLLYNIYDPENYYYRLASLDCLQAAKFVLSRNEVQADRVATEGGSQGGYFAVATAMLEPRIRCVAANVIAFTDYPDGMELASKGHHTQLREVLKDINTSTALAAKSLAYTDGVNLINRLKAPVQINMGGIDPVCNYVCGIVAFNRARNGVPKEFHVYPDAAHEVTAEMRAANRAWYDRWLRTDDVAKQE